MISGKISRKIRRSLVVTRYATRIIKINVFIRVSGKMEQIAGVRLLAQLGKHNLIDNRRGGRNPENGETISR